MTSHCLLALVIITVSCFALSSCSGGNITSELVTYPAQVLNTNQEGCHAEQQQIVRAEVKQDLRNILQHQNRVYTDCQDALTQGRNTSGVYTIKPDNQPKFKVYCDMDTDGGGWTVFQRREDGSVDFDRYWIDYQQGFGNISRDIWLGLEKIHRLTASAPNTQLRVDLQDFEGNSSYAHYAGFSVGDSGSNYTLSVSGYTGTAGNPFLGGLYLDHNGRQFSTRDRDNDIWGIGSGLNCAHYHRGGWWFHACVTANLNGIYYGNGTYTSRYYGYPDGMIWSPWRGYFYSLKFSEMKLRRN